MNEFLSYLTKITKKAGAIMPDFSLPIEKVNQYMEVINPILADANILFPVDDILAAFIVLGTLRITLLVIWVFKFVRDLLPF